MFLSIAKEAHPDYDLTPEEVADFIQERLNEIISPQPDYPLVPEDIPPGIEGPRTMRIECDTFTVKNSYDVLVNTADGTINVYFYENTERNNLWSCIVRYINFSAFSVVKKSLNLGDTYNIVIV